MPMEHAGVLWTEKYRPQRASDVVGHKDIVDSLRTWLENATDPETRSAVEPGFFLWGSPGLGKTSMVHAVCKDMGYECMEFNASDVRSLSMLSKLRSQLFASKSIKAYFLAERSAESHKTVVLLDEIDGIVSSDGLAEVVRWVQDPKRTVPLVFSSNSTLPTLRDICRSHMVLPVTSTALAQHLYKISTAEKLGVKLQTCKALSQKTAGDVRAAINLLQFGRSLDGISQSTSTLSHGPSADVVHANAEVFSYLLHPDCPEDALACWGVAVPCPSTLAEANAQFIGKPWSFLRQGQGAAVLPPKRSKFSMLSQWSLYKKNMH